MNTNNNHQLIWVRGAGELGSATAVSLFRSGFPVILSEINPPLAIRRTVTFSDAILDGHSMVEDVQATYLSLQDIPDSVSDMIPLYKDEPNHLLDFHPNIIVDARMKKSYSVDYRKWADFFIGLGPGFNTDENCHAVIETMRGHNLGRIIWDGAPQNNTGIPGNISGETKRRVLHSPSIGKLEWKVDFGDIVENNQLLGTVISTKITAPFSGIVRGLIHPDVPMINGLKIADIDPRKDVNYKSISDKSRSIGRGVLEAILSNIYGKRSI